jgi:serine protease inhibitor ecotin
MMQFEIGYGKYGGGIHYRPMLDIKYSIQEMDIKIKPNKVLSISKDEIKNTLESGFDKDGKRVYGYMEFSLDNLSDYNSTIITQAVIRIKNKFKFKNKKNTRYYVELIEVDEVNSYSDIKNRDKIEYIGYEVEENTLSTKEYNYFKFDTLSRLKLVELYKNKKNLQLLIKATSPDSKIKSRILKWDDNAELKIKYINKRRKPLKKVENFRVSKSNGKIKLSWDEIDSEDLRGYYVVRNSFHPPVNFSDGVKIYGGKDTYTYDSFGSLDKDKYYSIFSYDDVPNYSEAVSVTYNPLEVY